MKKVTRIAAAVALATASASASAWWVVPAGDQGQMLEAQREYAERLAAEQARVGEQMAAQQAQIQAAQREYAEQFAAEQVRVAEQIAAQQAEMQAAQRKYAEEVAAAQMRIAEHMAAQQAEAQAVQREYAKLLAAQQARVLEAQQSYMQQFAANTPDPAQGVDMEAFSPLLPPPFPDPYRGDPLTWASPLNTFGDSLSSIYEERLKESEARRNEWRKTRDLRRTETGSRRAAALKKLEERRQARLRYVGLRKPFDAPTREEI